MRKILDGQPLAGEASPAPPQKAFLLHSNFFPPHKYSHQIFFFTPQRFHPPKIFCRLEKKLQVGRIFEVRRILEGQPLAGCRQRKKGRYTHTKMRRRLSPIPWTEMIRIQLRQVERDLLFLRSATEYLCMENRLRMEATSCALSIQSSDMRQMRDELLLLLYQMDLRDERIAQLMQECERLRSLVERTVPAHSSSSQCQCCLEDGATLTCEGRHSVCHSCVDNVCVRWRCRGAKG